MFGEEFLIYSNEQGVLSAADSQYSWEILDETNQKRTREEEIHWTEPREYVLACVYKSKKAYMKVKGDKLNLDHKRLLAFHEIKEHPSFRDVSNLLTSGGVHQKFIRMMTNVISKYALDGEGANLSGLPESAPRVETVLYKMVEEKFQIPCVYQISRSGGPIDLSVCNLFRMNSYKL